MMHDDAFIDSFVDFAKVGQEVGFSYHDLCWKQTKAAFLTSVIYYIVEI